MFSKHTRTPWRRDGKTRRAVEARAFDGSWRFICEKIRGGTKEEAEANVKLIVASPELLVTMIDVKYYLVADAFTKQEIIQRVEAVIAQATGSE